MCPFFGHFPRPVRLAGLLLPCVLVCVPGRVHASDEALLELDHRSAYTVFTQRQVVEASTRLLQRGPDGITREQMTRLHLRRAEARIRLGDFQGADEDVAAILQFSPGHEEGRILKVRILVHKKQLGDAKNLIAAVLDDFPRSAMAWAQCGAVHGKLGQLDDSLRCADRALSLDDKLLEGYYCRALVRYGRGDWKLCVEDLDQTLRLAPLWFADGKDDRYLFRASAQTKLGDFRGALESLAMAQRLDPTSIDLLRLKWDLHSKLSQYSVCLVTADQLVRLDSRRPEGHFLRAYSLHLLGKPREALAVAERALAEHPKDHGTLILAALDSEILGQYAKAIEHYDRALEAAPDNRAALVGKASLLATCMDAKFRDGKAALQLARKNRSVNGNDGPDGHMAMAFALAECGLYEEAQAEVKNAIKAAGNDKSLVSKLEKAWSLFRDHRPWRGCDLRP